MNRVTLFITGAASIVTVGILFAAYRYETTLTDRSVYERPIDGADASLDASATDSGAFSFSFLDTPRALPEVHFADADGRDLSLGDFRGRPILLNIWATWCVPCRKEMPALDRLHAAAPELLVLPLSIDRQGASVVKTFYAERGLKTLGIYVDQSGKAPRDLNTVGVPTTLLIDRDGREIGRKMGAAEWDRADMVTLIRQHLDAEGPR